jgi:hypothetical protein
MALVGAGISHTGQTKATQPAVSDRWLAAEVDVSGDKAVPMLPGSQASPSAPNLYNPFS